MNCKKNIQMIKYKTKWKEKSLNKSFWKEVLVGRTISKLKFGKEGLTSIILDNGEELFLLRELGTFCIHMKDKD